MILDGDITCIKLKKFGLTYIPLPKNCSSSIKTYLYEIIHGKSFRRRKLPSDNWFHIHTYFNKANKKNPHRESVFKPNDADVEKAFVVIREPIKRYISAFANRVVSHGALSGSQNLTLNAFTNDFETYIKDVIELNHHMSPQTDWVGNDLSAFDWVFTTNEIQKMHKIISEYTNTNIEFPRLQIGGPKLNLTDLSKENFYRLIDYYYEDYRVFKDYFTIDSVIHEYRKLVDGG